jgi:glycosyltransferase involved in cell wall biosynthesis
MITYNHEKYITQAIEGVLNQKTNLDFELVIGEDCSTDSTKEIVYKYKKRYPKKIKVITSETNIGIIPNFIRTLNCCKGKYIAICDGDDYWTDPHKIQKQFDFLEAHPDYGLVHTDNDVLYDRTGKIIKSVNKKENKNYKNYYNPFYGILTGEYVIHTLTAMVRKKLIEKAISTEIFNKKYKRADLQLWLELANHTNFYYINESTAVYRIRRGSITRPSFIIQEIEDQEESKIIRIKFAKRYNVPPEIFQEVEKMYNIVLLHKAYFTNNKELAKKSYKKLKYYKNFEHILLYIGAKRKIIKHLIEILRRARLGYYKFTNIINRKKI